MKSLEVANECVRQDIVGCEKTEDMVSQIMNELMTRLGKETDPAKRQSIENRMDRLKQVENVLTRWKYQILFEQEEEKLLELEEVQADILQKNNLIQSQSEATNKLFEELKHFYHIKIASNMMIGANERLLQISKSLEQAINKAQQIKQQIQKCHREFRSFQTQTKQQSQRLSPVLRKIQLNIKNEIIILQAQKNSLQRELQKLQQKNKAHKFQLQKEPKIAMKPFKQAIFPYAINQPQERDIVHTILKIEPPKHKFAEDPISQIRYQKLKPKKQYTSQFQIYFIALVFILLGHYVAY